MQSDWATSNKVRTTEHGIPIRNLWYMLLYAWDAIPIQDRFAADIEDAPSLQTLLARVLARCLEQRMRIGLGNDYCTNHSEIPGIRGRVDFSESLKRMSFKKGRSVCRYSVFSPNVPKNQIIRSLLQRLVQVGEFGGDSKQSRNLRTRLARLVYQMPSVDLIDLDAAMVSRAQSQRHDPDYRLMLAICALLIQRQMPTEERGQTFAPNLPWESFVLHKVYETFVARFFQHHLEDWRVTAQKHLKWPVERPSDYIPKMIPDLIMEHAPTGCRIVLDTKFTKNVLVTNLSNNERFSSGDLYQIYAYLRSQENVSVSTPKKCTGILLYPTVNRSVSEAIRLQGYTFRWETVNLAQPWDKIEAALLQLPIRCLVPMGVG
mgnify:CR=1 FL=1